MRNYPGPSWETWEDELTAIRVTALIGDLKKFPPVYITVPAALGIKPKEEATLDDVMALFPMEGMPRG